MRKTVVIFITMACLCAGLPSARPAEPAGEYTLGIDDAITVGVLQPEELSVTVTISPDGTISFPYIGCVKVAGLTLTAAQELIRERLADGFMNYPVVSVFLVESRSRKFFVYGEVAKPGAYQLEENTTALRAISIAGGFTKFGSSSRVKILRLRKNAPGYEALKVNMKEVMDGNAEKDVLIESGDVIVVSEGAF